MAVPGELLIPANICDRDRLAEDGGCGCSRSFVGMSSAKGTSRAVVAEVEHDRPALVALAGDAAAAAAGKSQTHTLRMSSTGWSRPRRGPSQEPCSSGHSTTCGRKTRAADAGSGGGQVPRGSDRSPVRVAE